MKSRYASVQNKGILKLFIYLFIYLKKVSLLSLRI